MPRKTRRKARPMPGKTKHRDKLADQWLANKGRSLSISAALQKVPFQSATRGYNRILNGRHPTTNEPLPVGEDGREYIP